MGRKVLPPVHPGEILFEEFMKPLGISQNRLARDLKVPPRRINEIVHAKRGINRYRTEIGAAFQDLSGVLDQPPDAL